MAILFYTCQKSLYILYFHYLFVNVIFCSPEWLNEFAFWPFTFLTWFFFFLRCWIIFKRRRTKKNCEYMSGWKMFFFIISFHFFVNHDDYYTLIINDDILSLSLLLTMSKHLKVYVCAKVIYEKEEKNRISYFIRFHVMILLWFFSFQCWWIDIVNVVYVRRTN